MKYGLGLYINSYMNYSHILLLTLLLINGYGWCFKTALADTDKIRCLDYSDDGRYLATGC